MDKERVVKMKDNREIRTSLHAQVFFFSYIEAVKRRLLL
jgi:hypothetical protein